MCALILKILLLNFKRHCGTFLRCTKYGANLQLCLRHTVWKSMRIFADKLVHLFARYSYEYKSRVMNPVARGWRFRARGGGTSARHSKGWPVRVSALAVLNKNPYFIGVPGNYPLFWARWSVFMSHYSSGNVSEWLYSFVRPRAHTARSRPASPLLPFVLIVMWLFSWILFPRLGNVCLYIFFPTAV